MLNKVSAIHFGQIKDVKILHEGMFFPPQVKTISSLIIHIS